MIKTHKFGVYVAHCKDFIGLFPKTGNYGIIKKDNVYSAINHWDRSINFFASFCLGICDVA